MVTLPAMIRACLLAAACVGLCALVPAGALDCASAAAAEPVALPAGTVAEFQIGSEGSEPIALAAGPQGTIWFGQDEPGALDRISSGGLLEHRFDLSDPPLQLALGPEGDMWFTASSGYREAATALGYVDAADQLTEFSAGTMGVQPEGIVAGPGGEMWFTGGESGLIGEIDQAGKPERFPVLPEVPDTKEMSSDPVAIARAADGTLWFTDLSQSSEGRSYIDHRTESGEVVKHKLPALEGPADAITAGVEGDVWFTQSPATIGRVTPAGVFTEFAVPSVSGSVNGITAGPDGDIWFTEAADALGRITPAGEVTSFGPVLANGGLPEALVADGEGRMWFAQRQDFEESAVTIGRLVVPLAPAPEASPTLSGQAVVGQTLTVSRGSWAHAPTSFAYQWQVCGADGGDCSDLPGQTQESHTLGVSEAGDTVRAVVSAGNLAGAATASSAASAVVAGIASPPIQHQPALVTSVSQVLKASMTWRFGWSRSYTVVESLLVHGLPTQASIELSCRGRGCPFRSRHVPLAAVDEPVRCGRHGCRREKLGSGEVDLGATFARRRLLGGARLTVDLVRAGWIGKAFSFQVRTGAPPRVVIGCLTPGSATRTSPC